MKSRLIFLCACFFLVSSMSQVFAYGYSSAGKEPLIDAREAILRALENNDFKTAREELEKEKQEFLYLDKSYKPGLWKAITQGLDQEDAVAVDTALNQAFAAEIRRRLHSVKENIQNYQLSKTLLVKTEAFLDMMQVNLPAQQRKDAKSALKLCLASIGNPGIFGVGTMPANPKQFEEQMKILIQALQPIS